MGSYTRSFEIGFQASCAGVVHEASDAKDESKHGAGDGKVAQSCDYALNNYKASGRASNANWDRLTTSCPSAAVAGGRGLGYLAVCQACNTDWHSLSYLMAPWLMTCPLLEKHFEMQETSFDDVVDMYPKQDHSSMKPCGWLELPMVHTGFHTFQVACHNSYPYLWPPWNAEVWISYWVASNQDMAIVFCYSNLP